MAVSAGPLVPMWAMAASFAGVPPFLRGCLVVAMTTLLWPTAAAPSAVVLLGPTGAGKSETGNTLLGDRRFKVSAGLESETLMPQAETVSFNGRDWQVVDTPGYFDTSRSP